MSNNNFFRGTFMKRFLTLLSFALTLVLIAAALSTFINGVDSDRDGKLDFAGVKDIKIGLKTYSTSGN